MQRLMLEKFETKIDVFHFFHDAAQKKREKPATCNQPVNNNHRHGNVSSSNNKTAAKRQHIVKFSPDYSCKYFEKGKKMVETQLSPVRGLPFGAIFVALSVTLCFTQR